MWSQVLQPWPGGWCLQQDDTQACQGDESCLEGHGTQIEGNRHVASRAPNEQALGSEGARTKLPALLSQPLFSSSHTCAKRLLAPGSW